MKFKFLSAVVVGLFFQAYHVQAQEKLTLQQAIQFALDNKADAKKSQLDVENAQYQIDEVRAGALPQINLNGGMTYNVKIQKSALDLGSFGSFGGGNSTDGTASSGGGLTLVGMGTPWSSTNTLSLSQQIFNQSLFTGLKAARTTREFYQINKELTDEQLIEKVANAYYEVYQTDLQLQTIQNNLDNTVETHKVVDGLVHAGLAKKIDLDRLTVAVNNLEAEKQQVVNTQSLRENALKFAIGMDIQNDISLPEETFDINPSIALEETIDVANRTELRVLEKQMQLLELNKKSVISEYYPKLSLTANYGYAGFSNDFFLFKPKESVWADFSTVGISLTMPIFNGGLTKAKVNKANIELSRLKVDLVDTKLGLSLASENAKSQIRNSILTVDANRRNVTLAKELLDNTNNNYKNGLATLTDLLDAEKAYADAQNNYNTALLNYKIAEVQLIKANGNLKSLVNE